MHTIPRRVLVAFIIAVIVSIPAYQVIAGNLAVPSKTPEQSVPIIQKQPFPGDTYKLHNITSVTIVLDDKLAKWYDENTLNIQQYSYKTKNINIKTIKADAPTIIKYATSRESESIKVIVIAYTHVSILKQIPLKDLKHSKTFIVIVDDTGKGINPDKIIQLGYPATHSSGGEITEKGIVNDIIGAVMIGYPYGTLSSTLYSVPKYAYHPLAELNDIIAEAISEIDNYYVTLPGMLQH